MSTLHEYLGNKITNEDLGIMRANAQRSATKIIGKLNSSLKGEATAEFERVIDEKREGGTKWAFSMLIDADDRRAHEMADMLDDMSSVAEANVEDGSKGKTRIIVRMK